MSELYQNSLFAGVTISLLAYALGMFLRKKLKLGIFNPLLISIVLTIIFLACTGIEYDTYNQGAAYLSWLLITLQPYVWRFLCMSSGNF